MFVRLYYLLFLSSFVLAYFIDDVPFDLDDAARLYILTMFSSIIPFLVTRKIKKYSKISSSDSPYIVPNQAVGITDVKRIKKMRSARRLNAIGLILYFAGIVIMIFLLSSHQLAYANAGLSMVLFSFILHIWSLVLAWIYFR